MNPKLCLERAGRTILTLRADLTKGGRCQLWDASIRKAPPSNYTLHILYDITHINLEAFWLSKCEQVVGGILRSLLWASNEGPRNFEMKLERKSSESAMLPDGEEKPKAHVGSEKEPDSPRHADAGDVRWNRSKNNDTRANEN